MGKFFSLLLATGCLASTAVAATSSNRSDISRISRQVSAIEKNADSLRRVEGDIEADCVCSEEACFTGYFEGPKLRKIVARYYGEGGYLVKEYYYGTEELIFVLISHYQYKQPLGSPPYGTLSPKVHAVDHDRYYFKNGKLLR